MKNFTPLSDVKTGTCGARYIALHKITLPARIFSVRLEIACESERRGLKEMDFYKMCFLVFRAAVFQAAAIFLFSILLSASSSAGDLKNVSPEKPAQNKENCRDNKEPVLSGVVYRGPGNWVVWFNGQKVTPEAIPKEIISIDVAPDGGVRLKWFDVCGNYIVEAQWKSFSEKLRDQTEPVPAKRAKICITADDCKDFCKGAGSGKECLPDGVPVCSMNVCGCALACR